MLPILKKIFTNEVHPEGDRKQYFQPPLFLSVHVQSVFFLNQIDVSELLEK